MYDTSNVRVARENPYIRPLENARRVAGGDVQLAEALRISTEALSKWLSGEATPPMRTYMAAIHFAGRSSLRRRAA